jgi:hypothetical protein
VVKATTDADQFYRLAVTLKQVANFYNRIGKETHLFCATFILKTRLLRHFYTKNDHFTKTGSGQT